MASLTQTAEEIVSSLQQLYRELPEAKRTAFRDYLIDSLFNPDVFKIPFFHLGAADSLERKIELVVNQINSLDELKKPDFVSYIREHQDWASQRNFPYREFYVGYSHAPLASLAVHLMLMQAGIIENYQQVKERA